MSVAWKSTTSRSNHFVALAIALLATALANDLDATARQQLAVETLAVLAATRAPRRWSGTALALRCYWTNAAIKPH